MSFENSQEPEDAPEFYCLKCQRMGKSNRRVCGDRGSLICRDCGLDSSEWTSWDWVSEILNAAELPVDNGQATDRKKRQDEGGNYSGFSPAAVNGVKA